MWPHLTEATSIGLQKVMKDWITTKLKEKHTIVANVTDMKTRDALLKFISSAVPRAVGTTVKGKAHIQC